jgi:hypothetical protein
MFDVSHTTVASKIFNRGRNMTKAAFIALLLLWCGSVHGSIVTASFTGEVIVTTYQNASLPAPPSIGSRVTGSFTYDTNNLAGVGTNFRLYRSFSPLSSFNIEVAGMDFAMDLTALDPDSPRNPAGLEIQVRNDAALGGSLATDVFELQGFGSDATFPFTVSGVNEVFFSIQDTSGGLIEDESLPTSLDLSGAPFQNFVAMVYLHDGQDEWAFVARLDVNGAPKWQRQGGRKGQRPVCIISIAIGVRGRRI